MAGGQHVCVKDTCILDALWCSWLCGVVGFDALVRQAIHTDDMHSRMQNPTATHHMVGHLAMAAGMAEQQAPYLPGQVPV